MRRHFVPDPVLRYSTDFPAVRRTPSFFHTLYDAEGNRSARYVWTDADSDAEIDPGERSAITEYAWDNRNRLVRVTERPADGAALTKAIDYLYDTHNRWIARIADLDGAGEDPAETTRLVYDENQIALQLAASGAISNRYLWGPAVDQLLADEQFPGSAAAATVLFPLADQIGTVRDLAAYAAATGTTEITIHRAYSSFGVMLDQTGIAFGGVLLGFTARPCDPATGLQNNLARWYDALLGGWANVDPVSFVGADANMGRYVENDPLTAGDPTGLQRPSVGHRWAFETESNGGMKDKETAAAEAALEKAIQELLSAKKGTLAYRLGNLCRNLAAGSWKLRWHAGYGPHARIAFHDKWLTLNPRYTTFCPEIPEAEGATGAVVLAHELGHMLFGIRDPENVELVENQVRNDLGIGKRRESYTFSGTPPLRVAVPSPEEARKKRVTQIMLARRKGDEIPSDVANRTAPEHIEAILKEWEARVEARASGAKHVAKWKADADGRECEYQIGNELRKARLKYIGWKSIGNKVHYCVEERCDDGSKRMFWLLHDQVRTQEMKDFLSQFTTRSFDLSDSLLDLPPDPKNP